MTKSGAGLIVGAYSGAVLVASLPVGHLSDRLGSRRLTIGATLLFAATFPLLGVADSTAQLIAVRAAQGLCSAVSWSAGLAWLSAAADPERRGASLAIVNAGAAVASIVGPAIGGPLVAAVGLGPAMLILTGVMLVLFAGLVREPAPPPAGHDDHSLRTAAAAARSSPLLRAAFAGMLYVSLVGGTVQVLAPLHLAGEGLGKSQIGLVFDLSGAVAACVTLVIGGLGDRLDRVRLIGLMLGVLAAAAIPFALSPPTWAYIGLLAFQACCNAGLFALLFPLAAEGASEAGVGQGIAMGALGTIWAVGAFVAPVGASSIAQHSSDAAAFLVVVALALPCLALAGARRRQLAIAD